MASLYRAEDKHMMVNKPFFNGLHSKKHWTEPTTLSFGNNTVTLVKVQRLRGVTFLP